MSDSFDYTALAETLVKLLNDELSLTLIESDSNGPRPEEPFLTYSVIAPYLPITIDIVDNEQFECVLSLTVHEKSKLKALTIAERVRKFFSQTGTRLLLKEKDIIVVSAMKAQARDNFISIDYERLAGFDLRLRVKDSFVDGTKEMIEKIDINQEEST